MKKFLFMLLILLFPSLILAGNFSIDARTQGIASAGTASANFLSAGFYNPALAALGNKGRHLGVLFPTFGVRYRDSNQLIDKLEDFSGVYHQYSLAPAKSSAQAHALQSIQDLQQNSAIITGGIAGAAGIATENISGVFFINAFTEGVALADITQKDLDNFSSGTLSPPTSNARVVGYGLIDLGLTLAKKIHIAAQPLALGLTPKIQQIYTYHHLVSILDFDSDDWTDISNRTDDSTLNLDIGGIWYSDRLRIGIVGKNLFSKRLTTQQKVTRYTFRLNPLFTLGSAYRFNSVIVSADIDLNVQKRFMSNPSYPIKDDTQLVRFGTEYQFNPTTQIRAGYAHDLEQTYDDTFSIGLGLGIDELARVDIALDLIDKNSYGALIQLSFSL